MIRINDIEIPYSGTIELTVLNTAVIDESTWTFPFTVPFCDELTEAIGYIHLAESHNVIGKKFKMVVELQFVRHVGECTCSNVTTEGVELSFIENTDFYTLANKTNCTDLNPEYITIPQTDIADTLTNPDNYDYIFAPCKAAKFGETIGIDFDNIGGVDYSVINQSKDAPLVIPFVKLNKALAKVFSDSGITLASNSLKLFSDIWLYNNFNLKWLYFGFNDTTPYAWLVSITSGNDPTATICYRNSEATFKELQFPYNSMVSISVNGKTINAQMSDYSRSAKKENTRRHYATFKIKNLTLDKPIYCGVELQSITLENGIDMVGYTNLTEKDGRDVFILPDEDWVSWINSRKCYSSLLVTVTDTSRLGVGMPILIDELMGLEVTIDQIVDDKSFRILRRELTRKLNLNPDASKREKPTSLIDGFKELIGDIIEMWHDWDGIVIRSAISEEVSERCEYKIGLNAGLPTHIIYKQNKVYSVKNNAYFAGVPADSPNMYFNLTKHLPYVTINEFLTAIKNTLGLAITIQNRTAYIETWNYILSQNPIDITSLAGIITETQLDGYDAFKIKLAGTGNAFFENVKELDSYEVGTTGDQEPSESLVSNSLYLNTNNNCLYNYSPNFLSSLGNWKIASYNYKAFETNVVDTSTTVLQVESEAGVPFVFCTTLARLKVTSGGKVGSWFELNVGDETYRYSYKVGADNFKYEFEDTRPNGYATALVSNLYTAIKNSIDLLKEFEISDGSGEWDGWLILKNRNEYKKVEFGFHSGITINVIEERIDAFIPYLSQPGTFSIYEKTLRPATGVLLCRGLGIRHDVFESGYFDKTPNHLDYDVPFSLEMSGENGLYEKLWKAYIDWQLEHKKTVKTTIDFNEETYLSGNWLRLFKIKQCAYIVKQIDITLDFGQNKLIFGDSELIKV